MRTFGPGSRDSEDASMTELSGYELEILRHGQDFTLYRGRQHGNLSPVLVVAFAAEQPAHRKNKRAVSNFPPLPIKINNLMKARYKRSDFPFLSAFGVSTPGRAGPLFIRGPADTHAPPCPVHLENDVHFLSFIGSA
jgi:hypothetical protein